LLCHHHLTGWSVHATFSNTVGPWFVNTVLIQLSMPPLLSRPRLLSLALLVITIALAPTVPCTTQYLGVDGAQAQVCWPRLWIPRAQRCEDAGAIFRIPNKFSLSVNSDGELEDRHWTESNPRHELRFAFKPTRSHSLEPSPSTSQRRRYQKNAAVGRNAERIKQAKNTIKLHRSRNQKSTRHSKRVLPSGRPIPTSLGSRNWAS
jgi:hypothetical protein